MAMAMTVYKTKWYLVRADRSEIPWKFYVLTKPFGSQKEAWHYAHIHRLDNSSHEAWRGRDVQARIDDQQHQDIEVIWEMPHGT